MRDTYRSTITLILFCGLIFASACEKTVSGDSNAAKKPNAQVTEKATTTSAAPSSCQQYAEAVCEICGRTKKACRSAIAKFHKCDQGKNCQHKVCSNNLLDLKKNKPEENKAQFCAPE